MKKIKAEDGSIHYFPDNAINCRCFNMNKSVKIIQIRKEVTEIITDGEDFINFNLEKIRLLEKEIKLLQEENSVTGEKVFLLHKIIKKLDSEDCEESFIQELIEVVEKVKN